MMGNAEPSLTHFEPPRERRTRGRPRLPVPGTSVSTWLHAHEHDRLIQLANRRAMSVSSLIRQLLIVRLP